MSPVRYKLIILYRGSRYHGWQQQPALESFRGEPPPEGEGLPTIQGKLSRAIAQVVGHPVSIRGSSRTDAGVHAKGQVAHFDTMQQNIPAEGLRRAINHKLPGDILIRSIQQVGPRFDAIHSTISKRYQYFIWNQLDRPVFFNDLAWHRWQTLDTDAMAQAAGAFVGERDFASFARPGHGRESTVRTILSCEVTCRSPKIVIGIEGTGFLWNMVRIIVGTLVQVGLGRYAPEDIATMLAAKSRAVSGPTAPPHGLYLQWIRTRAEDEEMEEEKLEAQKLEARSQELEGKCEEQEARSQEPEVGSQEMEVGGEREIQNER